MNDITTLNRKYLTTIGNKLYVLCNINGQNDMDVRIATIRNVVFPEQKNRDDFCVVLDVQNSYTRYAYFTNSIIHNTTTIPNSILYRYAELYFITTEPIQLRKAIKHYFTYQHNLNETYLAIKQQYIRNKQLIKMYGKNKQTQYKNNLNTILNNFKKLIK